jgi:hypothetical protein
MFNDRNLDRTQLVSNLYGSILFLAMFSFLFGMQLFSMARDLGRGDPYHVVHWTEFSVVAMLVAIISSAFRIHGWIQRLVKFDSEQKPDSASR